MITYIPESKTIDENGMITIYSGNFDTDKNKIDINMLIYYPLEEINISFILNKDGTINYEK